MGASNSSFTGWGERPGDQHHQKPYFTTDFLHCTDPRHGSTSGTRPENGVAALAFVLPLITPGERAMPRPQNALDRQPGRTPDISQDGRGLTYVIHVAAGRLTYRLILRCDNDGEVWMSIAHDTTSD